MVVKKTEDERWKLSKAKSRERSESGTEDRSSKAYPLIYKVISNFFAAMR